MEDPKTTRHDFDLGVDLFLKVLTAQPGLLKLEPGAHQVKGQQLANMAVAFSMEYYRLKHQHCGG